MQRRISWNKMQKNTYDVISINYVQKVADGYAEIWAKQQRFLAAGDSKRVSPKKIVLSKFEEEKHGSGQAEEQSKQASEDDSDKGESNTESPEKQVDGNGGAGGGK